MQEINCIECTHYGCSVYMETEDETLYNCWCNESMDVIKVSKTKECSKFDQK